MHLCNSGPDHISHEALYETHSAQQKKYAIFLYQAWTKGDTQPQSHERLPGNATKSTTRSHSTIQPFLTLYLEQHLSVLLRHSQSSLLTPTLCTSFVCFTYFRDSR